MHTGRPILSTPQGAYVVRPGTLGSGSFASIVRGDDLRTGQPVALKILHNTDELDPAREALALRKVGSHPNVVRCLEYAPRATLPNGDVVDVMVLELARGDMFDFLSAGGALPEPVARFYFVQLLAALQHCHSNGVYHRDIKPDNLLLDFSWNLRLGDFGFAASTAPGAHLSTVLGSGGFVAPEVQRGAMYSGAAADIWSAGCVLFCLLHASMPFPELGRRWYMDRIRLGQHATYFKAHRRTCTISEAAEAFLTKVLQHNPAARPSIAELLADPWVVEGMQASPSAVQAVMEHRVPLVGAAAGHHNSSCTSMGDEGEAGAGAGEVFVMQHARPRSSGSSGSLCRSAGRTPSGSSTDGVVVAA